VSWRISSCFDCKLLQERGKDYYCLAFQQIVSYDVARTVNDCERKVPFEEEVKSERTKLLDKLFDQCMSIADTVQGPFTVKDLVLITEYQNKNSLWQMLEELVQQGRLRKGKMRVANMYGHTYHSNIYLPVWPKG
jgi:hypothetical protein